MPAYPRDSSAHKNAMLSLMLWRLADANGDAARVELARAGLAHCGYPGGEGAPPIAEAMAAVEASDAQRRDSATRE